jgi:site-specific DNA recombinase
MVLYLRRSKNVVQGLDRAGGLRLRGLAGPKRRPGTSPIVTYLAELQNNRTSNAASIDDRGTIEQLVATIKVNMDKLVVRFKSNVPDDASDSPEDRSISIPWQKPPSKRRREILLPSNKSRSEVRPQHFERRAQLVSAIARGRQWLDDIVSVG